MLEVIFPSNQHIDRVQTQHTPNSLDVESICPLECLHSEVPPQVASPQAWSSRRQLDPGNVHQALNLSYCEVFSERDCPGQQLKFLKPPQFCPDSDDNRA